MVNMAEDQAVSTKIDQLKNTVRGFGWVMVAQDTRGDTISVTLQIPREEAIGPKPVVRPGS